jgi:hypothetical protein
MENNKLPTAKELFDIKFKEGLIWNEDIVAYAIEFAKIQVEAALAHRDRLYQTYYDRDILWAEANIKFIKDSYPLSNIK